MPYDMQSKTFVLYRLTAGWRIYLYVNWVIIESDNGPRARYVTLRVAHAPGMPGTLSPPPRFSHARAVMHAESITSEEMKNQGPSYMVFYASGGERHRPGVKGVSCVWTLTIG